LYFWGIECHGVCKESRDTRMLLAEKKAAGLPPKLTVPMILFFLPVLFAAAFARLFYSGAAHLASDGAVRVSGFGYCPIGRPNRTKMFHVKHFCPVEVPSGVP
jgi:hypothetical protein